MNRAAAIVLIAACAPVTAVAQYPLTPSPALDFRNLRATATPAGFGMVRRQLDADTNSFVVKQARLTIQGKPLPYAALRVQANFAALSNTPAGNQPASVLTDAYIQFSPPDSSTRYPQFRPALIVGQFKAPFSLEYLTGISTLLTADRSQAIDSLSPRRDIGVMGQVQGWNRVVLAAALMNGQGSNNPGNVAGKEMVMGRLTLIPVVGSLAVAGKWLAYGGDHRWGADVRWFSDPQQRTGSLVAEGEWIRRSGSLTPGTMTTDGNGGYALILWHALPWLEPVVKWEKLREEHTTGASSAERRLTWITYGVVVRSPEPTQRLRVQLNWVAKNERPVAARNAFVTQLILQL